MRLRTSGDSSDIPIGSTKSKLLLIIAVMNKILLLKENMDPHHTLHQNFCGKPGVGWEKMHSVTIKKERLINHSYLVNIKRVVICDYNFCCQLSKFRWWNLKKKKSKLLKYWMMQQKSSTSWACCIRRASSFVVFIATHAPYFCLHSDYSRA